MLLISFYVRDVVVDLIITVILVEGVQLKVVVVVIVILMIIIILAVVVIVILMIIIIIIVVVVIVILMIIIIALPVVSHLDIITKSNSWAVHHPGVEWLSSSMEQLLIL